MERNVCKNHIYRAPGGEESVDLFIEAGKRDISKTFFISSYFFPTFPVIACDSRHCVNKMPNKMSKCRPPKRAAGGTWPHSPSPPPSPCYATGENKCWLETNCQLTHFIRPNSSFEFRGQSLSLKFEPEIGLYFNKNNVSQRFYERVRTTL